MLRSGIKMGEYRPCFLWNNSCFVILTRKLADSIQGIKQHDRNKFDFVSDVSPKQLNALKAANLPVLNADEDFFFE